MFKILLFTFAICILFTGVFAQSINKAGRIEIPLKSGEKLTLINLEAKSVEYESKQGIRLSKIDDIQKVR